MVGELAIMDGGDSLHRSGARVRVALSGRRVAVEILLGFPLSVSRREDLHARLVNLLDVQGLELGTLEVQVRIAAHEVQPNLSPLARIRNVIAVGSGKGGVGKSTVAVNLALALAAEGARVGVLDADIYGPSVPMMLGLSGRPDSPDGKTIQPLRAHGVQAMSIGLLVDQDTPMIWRGPMATSALTQLLTETLWGDGEEPLDYLVVDLPPGTGDIQLTLAQKIPVAAAVIVTTPQDVATLDARKALKMFEKVEVPVLGLVENMAVHICSRCGHAEHVFGEGGGARMSEAYGVPLLGRLPLLVDIREHGDSGSPIVASQPASVTAAAFRDTALRLAVGLAQRPRATPLISASLV
ncbi:MAG: iron-sulfur cluster carrier protein ApbC [Pseudomonadota bacterium]|nr:iron-sulfur cluster carrier protein ApbC [Pseudomonadota bacterium]